MIVTENTNIFAQEESSIKIATPAKVGNFWPKPNSKNSAHKKQLNIEF